MVGAETHTVTAKLWLWPSDKAPANRHFLTIKGEAAANGGTGAGSILAM